MATTMPTLNPELVVTLKRLKLGRIVDTLPERLMLADKQDMSIEDVLLLVLNDEVSRRDSAAAGVRARDAGLDPAMRLELWDKTSKVSFEKRMLAELTSLRFLEAHRHVVVLGRRPFLRNGSDAARCSRHRRTHLIGGGGGASRVKFRPPGYW